MKSLPEFLRPSTLFARVTTGVTLVGAIIGIGAFVDNFTVAKTVWTWFGDHPTVAALALASLLLIDDLRQRFSKSGALIQAHHHQTVEEQRVKYLAFISASSGEESFYSLIFNHLVQSARTLSDQNTRLLVIPWFPADSFAIGKELQDDVRALQRVNNFNFAGLFVIPNEPDNDADDLRLLREVSENIIFLDVNFDPQAPPGDWDPCFVGGDEVRGARMAADIAVDYLTVTERLAPRLWVLKGRDTAWESQRHDEFVKAVEEAVPDATLVVSDRELMYSRKRARTYVYDGLRRAAHRDEIPDVIFACNDDMAVGAHDAIVHLIRGNVFAAPAAPRIVGYDGLDEVLDMIERGDELMLGTIDVSIKELANHAMVNMKRMIEGREVVDKAPRMHAIRAHSVLTAQKEAMD